MKITKETRGITLIALIITIIVLLIIAGVAISQLTNSNIFDKTQIAVDRYNAKAGETDALIGQLESLLDQYAGGSTQNPTPATPLEPTAVVATSGAEITYDANGGTGNINDGFVAPLGNGFIEWNTKADGSGDSYEPGDEVSTNTTLYAIWGGTYRLGQEVTINVAKGNETVTESFYVLIDDNTNSNGNITLLAKYNLDITPDPNDATGKYYQLPNANSVDTCDQFSSIVYWGEDEAVEDEIITIDLNNYDMSYNQTKGNNAIMRARDYATSTINSNAEGRLLTYEEADTLQSDYGTMIFGTANKQGEDLDEYYLWYWLSSVDVDYWLGWTDVCCVFGDETSIGTRCFDDQDGIGVRPVITVSKSLIQ